MFFKHKIHSVISICKLPNSLPPAILPCDPPLVWTDPASCPEVGRVVCCNLTTKYGNPTQCPVLCYLLHEMLGFCPGVQRHHPHPPPWITTEGSYGGGWGWGWGWGYIRHKDFLHSFVLLRNAQGTPPGFRNGLDWRALAKD